MQKQKQHKRFISSLSNDRLSLSIRYCDAQAGWISMPGVNLNDNKKKRPCCVHE